MRISVQAYDAEMGWCNLNARDLKPGMSAEEQAANVAEIASLYDGWLRSDKFGAHFIRIHTEQL